MWKEQSKWYKLDGKYIVWAKKNIKILFFHPCMWLWSLTLFDFMVFLNFWKQEDYGTFAKFDITCFISAASVFHRRMELSFRFKLTHPLSSEVIVRVRNTCTYSTPPMLFPTLLLLDPFSPGLSELKM